MQALECHFCTGERNRRNRLIMPNDARVHEEPFISAPYMHKNNEPKYYVMLLRAAEHAKTNRLHTLWFAAMDTPESPAQVAKNPSKLRERMARFLQFHDQSTAGIPGLSLLYTGLRARVTEKICKSKQHNLDTYFMYGHLDGSCIPVIA